MRRQGTIAALGEAALVRGYALAGVRVIETEGADAVRSAWSGLTDDVAVVILTPWSARIIGDAAFAPGAALTVVCAPAQAPAPEAGSRP